VEHGIGVWLEATPDGSLQVHVAKSLYVALEACGFLGALVAGLVTAWLVLP
jgi:hypothetical protein